MASGKVSEALASCPDIPFELGYIWDGFWELTTSRQIGFGTGPIPLTEIKAYIELFGIADVQLFVTCVRRLDVQYLKHLSADIERQKPNGK